MALLASLTIIQYSWSVHGSSFTLAILMGVTKALVGLNVQHDANHGAVSRQFPWINEALGFAADWIGGNKYLWRQQHYMHHSFTNHPQKDPDVLPCYVFKFFQFLPVWISFFPMVALYWFWQVFSLSSLWNLQHDGALAAGFDTAKGNHTQRRFLSLVLRSLYIYLNILRPFQVQNQGWVALGHIVLMGASGSLVLGTLFSLSHNFEKEAIRSLNQNKSSKEMQSKCWFRDQVETSCSYGGYMASWCTGGLNYQIEHHLFPRMNSAWYPIITDTVKSVCKEHGVKYTYFPTVWKNLLSTLRSLDSKGQTLGRADRGDSRASFSIVQEIFRASFDEFGWRLQASHPAWRTIQRSLAERVAPTRSKTK